MVNLMPDSPISPARTPMRAALETHPPKVETFHLAEMVNIDPKGFRREVDEYRLLGADCLYMRRGMDHPKFGYLESFLLPRLGLRVSIYHFRPGKKVEHVRYVDVVAIDRPDANTWRATDLYLDILEAPGSPAESPAGTPAIAPLPADAPTTILVEDVDELVAAHTQGLISDELTQFAIEAALSAQAVIAAHGDSIDAWLESLNLGGTWADHVELAPAAPGAPAAPAPKK